MDIQETLEWAEDPMNMCAEQPVIAVSSFPTLAEDLSEYSSVSKTPDEIIDIFMEQSKRFSACGANNSDEKWGVLRKNPKTGWQYIEDLITTN